MILAAVRRRPRRPAGLLVAALLATTACAGLRPSPLAAPPELGFLGEATLPPGTSFTGVPVGGLSGLAWEPRERLWLALSDDPGKFGPPRFYRLRVTLRDGRLADGAVEVVGVTPLRDAGGSGYAAESLDPEGLARAPDGSLWLSSEGKADRGLPPFVAHLDGDGREIARLALPSRYLPDAAGRRGVRNNLAFESLALTPDGRCLLAATENALVSDGPAADFGVASPARVLAWRLPARGAPREFAYRVEPVDAPPVAPQVFRVNGLADLLPLDERTFLALERQFVAGGDNRLRLFLVSLAGASDVRRRDGLADPSLRFARKQLLLDFATLGVPLDNFEGMALGPELGDGRRLLLVVSDDNFDPGAQRTRFLAFALRRR